MQVAIIAALLGSVAAPWVWAGQEAATDASSASIGTRASQSTSDTDTADSGRQAYREKGCHACHGLEGQGSPASGPRLGPNPIPLLAFTRYVRAPAGRMPPYTEKVVSDAELADMHAFLRARSGPASIDDLVPPSPASPQ